jgi:hypothetical protein
VKLKFAAPIFYSGTLISSIGSFTFNLCMIAFMVKAGFPLVDATLIFALQRIIPLIVIGIMGHLTDRFPAKPTVYISEAIAGVSSVGLLFIWKGIDTNYSLLVALCVIRSVVVAFQTGSRSKITKELSDGTYASNARNAIWFNKATQGAMLFSGLFSWLIIENLSFEFAVAFDAVSFILNGISVFLLPIAIAGSTADKADKSKSVSWIQKYFDLFRYSPRAAKLELLLGVVTMGTIAFLARIAGQDQSWLGKFMAAYGLAVWVSGFLERKVTSKFSSTPYWIVLGLSFFLLGWIGTPSLTTLAISFIKDLCFWVLLHRISSHIPIDSPKNLMGSIASARASLFIAILSLGEILVGAWVNVVPLNFEGSLRAVVALGIAGYVFLRPAKGATDDRSAL